jgi:hypothetical protein
MVICYYVFVGVWAVTGPLVYPCPSLGLYICNLYTTNNPRVHFLPSIIIVKYAGLLIKCRYHAIMLHMVLIPDDQFFLQFFLKKTFPP